MTLEDYLKTFTMEERLAAQCQLEIRCVTCNNPVGYTNTEDFDIGRLSVCVTCKELHGGRFEEKRKKLRENSK